MHTLKHVLAVPFFAIITLGIGFVGYISFMNGEHAVNDVTLRLRSEICLRINDHLRSYLSTPHQINESNAISMERRILDLNDPGMLQRHFWEQVQIYESVSSIYVGNEQGGLMNAGREPASDSRYIIFTDDFKSGTLRKIETDRQGNPARLLATVPGFDAKKRQWYLEAARIGAPVWSPVYILSTGQDMAIAASRPVYDERRRLLGVVAVDLFLSHLSLFLKNLKIAEGGHAFIMDRAGLLVASSTEEKPFLEVDGKPHFRRIHATESRIPLIHAAAEFLVSKIDDLQGIGAGKQFKFELDDQRQLLHILPFQDKYGLDWFIVVVLPEAIFMKHIEKNNLITLMLILTALIISTLSAVFISGRISRRIQLLEASAQSLANGQWDQPIPDTSRIAEIRNVTASFNLMAGQLKQYLSDLNREIETRKRTESVLQRSESHLRTLIDTLPDLIWLKDKDGVFLGCNMRFGRFFGAKEADIIGKTDFDFVDRELADFFRQHDMQAMAAGKPSMNEEEITFADDGHRELMETVKTPMYGADGELIGVLGIARDITGRKQAEDQIKANLREKETLLQEIHHRVKNNLAVVSSLLGMQADTADDEKLKNALMDSRNRVNSMAMIHEVLYQSDNLSSVDMKAYLFKLVNEVARTCQTSENVTIDMDINNISFEAKQASPIGLIVNEMVTNSFKYAFPDNRKGEIRIHLAETDGRCILRYCDTGIGIPEEVDLEDPKSMGFRLIKILSEGQLDGSIELIRDPGPCFVISFERKSRPNAINLSGIQRHSSPF